MFIFQERYIMEIIIGIIVVLVLIATFQVLNKNSFVKKEFKEVSIKISNGSMDNRILEMAKDGHTAIYGFVLAFMNEAEDEVKNELEKRGENVEKFNYDMEYIIKNAEKDIENSLIKRFKVLNINMDEYGVCSLK